MTSRPSCIPRSYQSPLDAGDPCTRNEGMDAKQAARERLAAAEADLLARSRRIHGTPELAFEEERAAGWVAEALDAAGFRVARGVGGPPRPLVAPCCRGPGR